MLLKIGVIPVPKGTNTWNLKGISDASQGWCDPTSQLVVSQKLGILPNYPRVLIILSDKPSIFWGSLTTTELAPSLTRGG